MDYYGLFSTKLSKISKLEVKQASNMNQEKYDLFLDKLRISGVKSIQLYTTFYGRSWNETVLGHKAFEHCYNEKRCFIFQLPDPNQQIALEKSDGVFVHVPSLSKLPSRKEYKRRTDQLWMFFTGESPIYTYKSNKYVINDLDDWFNLTYTIKWNHLLADLYDLKQLYRYQEVIDAFKEFSIQNNKQRINWNEKKLALWLVSHCNTASKREVYVEKLLEYINIDIYGHKQCRFKHSRLSPCDDESCDKKFYGSYKFYFSFENSLCTRYITEKYYKLYDPSIIFDTDILPVVRGAQFDDYLRVAPDNHSFIFADHFESPKSLADYLLYLDSNETAFNEYFKWKNDLKTKLISESKNGTLLKDEMNKKRIGRMQAFCELCAKLHDNLYIKSHQEREPLEISKFYNSEYDCKIPNIF